MQEYTTVLKDLFQKGLRPRERFGSVNEPMLTECLRLRPTESGIRACEAVALPGGQVWGAQLLRGKVYTFLASDHAVWIVDESDWSTVQQKLHDYLTDAPSYVLPSYGGHWHMADAGKFVMLFNGEVIVFISGAETMFAEEAKFYVVSDRTVNTGCYFKGRILMAGFSPTDFWADAWQSTMEGLTSTLAFDISTLMGVEKNFVYWSSIGGGNVLDIFYPERAIKGLIKEYKEGLSDPLFLDYWRRNDCGLMPATFQGGVQCLKPLGNEIVAYGEDGISIFTPATEPTPTFGVRHVASIGIHGRRAIGGTDSQHVFVDKEGVAWSLSTEGLKRLGYEEFTAGMIDETIIVTLDERNNEYYISDGNETLLLTSQGAGKSPYHPISLVLVEGQLAGIYNSDASTEGIVVSDIFDFKNADFKTITTIELGMYKKETANAYIALDYRYSGYGDFTRSTWMKVNDAGWVRMQITANQFRLCIKISDYENFKLDYANIKWQQSGHRTIRGLHADTANA